MKLTELHEEKMNLWEMANLSPEDTGVPRYTIWVSSGQAVKHGPRIKVTKGIRWKENENATVTIQDTPKVIGGDSIGMRKKEYDAIAEWVILNKDLLLRFWKGRMSTKALLDQLVPL